MWESCVVTKSGAELLGRLSGAELTGAKFGLSTVPEAALALQTEVTAPGGNLGIEGFKLIEGGFSATVRITNKGVREEYTVKQIGLYARERGGVESVLLAVTQDEIGSRIPSESEMPDFSLQFTIIVGVSNEAEITAIVDSSVFVSREQVEKIVSTEIKPITEQIEEHIKDGGKHITAEKRIKWNGKADKNNLDAHINNKSNPHAVTKAQVGLGNVPNVATNDQTPTYTAASVLSELSSGEKLSVSFGRLAKAVKDLITHIADNVRHVTAAERSAWNGKAASNHSHPAASASAAGLMSAADKSKLDGIAAGANKYTHPASAGNKHIPAGGSSGQILRWSADGTAAWGADNNTTYGVASQSVNGLMSAADKKKLDGVAAGANKYIHPAYTARTGAPTANQTPAFGGTFSITQPVSDGSGHITAMNSRTVKIPNNVASGSAAGLMSAADKSKLNEIKVSGINATYGKETISKATTGPISKTVTISHKTDIVFLWVLNYAAYGTVIVLNSYANSEMLAGSFTVRLSQSTNSAALEFTGGSNLDETVYYAAFRMS